MAAQQLFQPFRLKSLELKNRIVMAPMTRSFSPEGVPTPKVADYYARRAEGEELRAYIRTAVGRLLASDAFSDALPGYLLPDAASQARIGLILNRLQALSRC